MHIKNEGPKSRDFGEPCGVRTGKGSPRVSCLTGKCHTKNSSYKALKTKKGTDIVAFRGAVKSGRGFSSPTRPPKPSHPLDLATYSFLVLTLALTI